MPKVKPPKLEIHLGTNQHEILAFQAWLADKGHKVKLHKEKYNTWNGKKCELGNSPGTKLDLLWVKYLATNQPPIEDRRPTIEMLLAKITKQSGCKIGEFRHEYWNPHCYEWMDDSGRTVRIYDSSKEKTEKQ